MKWNETKWNEHNINEHHENEHHENENRLKWMKVKKSLFSLSII